MREMINQRLAGAIARTEPRGLPLAIGRSILAAAGLVTILLSSNADLFIRTVEQPTGVRCTGVHAVALWCLTGPTETGLLIGRAVSVAVFVAVLAGFRPKWTCVPHWYVTFSLASAVELANGGDTIAQVATMLLIPLCLGDDRVWGWAPVTRPLEPGWRGSAFAAHFALRLQISAIYLGAVGAKLLDPLWQHGTALFVVGNHPQYGFPPVVRDLLEPVLGTYWLVAVLSWSVIAAQVLIAVLMLSRHKHRVVALVLGCGLHLGIAIFMSLPSFGVIMVGLLVAGSASVLPVRQVVTEKEGIS